MLPVSPDCPLLIAPLVCLRSVSCGPNVASVSGLSIIDCPFWFVFVQCLVVLMLPVSPDCPLLIAPLVCLRSVSCGPNVASVSGLSIIDCPFGVFVQCLVVLMLPVSPDCPLLIAPLVCLRSVSCGPNVASVSGLSIIDCPFGLSSFSVLWS